MEIVGDDGSEIELKEDSDFVFGRGQGHQPKDLNVSRRHISFKLSRLASPSPRVSFEVIGKNPIWVRRAENGEIMSFRRYERGEMFTGDSFCVSAKDPVWFKLKDLGVSEIEHSDKLGDREMDLSVDLERASSGLSSDKDDLGSFDVSSINPVQEFGFLVIGHEFDNYPKQMIRDVKTWNWFLEEPSVESTDDEGSDVKGKKKPGRKRKKSRGAENNDDEEWTGESEDEKEVATRVKKAQGLKYPTRSKDRLGSHKDVGSGKASGSKRSKMEKEVEDEDDEDEEDETLGGFIVDDGNDEDGEEKEEEEEEEFEEGEDDE